MKKDLGWISLKPEPLYWEARIISARLAPPKARGIQPVYKIEFFVDGWGYMVYRAKKNDVPPELVEYIESQSKEKLYMHSAMISVIGKQLYGANRKGRD